MKTVFILIFCLISIAQAFSQENKVQCSSSDRSAVTYEAKSAPYYIKNPNILEQISTGTTGITTTGLFDRKFYTVGQAKTYNPVKKEKIQENLTDTQLDNYWKLSDSVYFNKYIPAGKTYGVKINTHTLKFDIISPYALTDAANAALKKSPSWIRPALEYTFSQLSVTKQNVFAGVINNAVDPYIDEIAFAIAYSTPTFLTSNYCNPQVFVDNAMEIYSHDKDLPYVDVVDYGSSTTDDNYYSTVKYWRKDTTGQRVQVEVPREIYYMYIVHPKTSDEIQAFINPTVTESNSSHSNNIAAPPTGQFWRDFLYTHTEPNLNDSTGGNYPILKDSMVQCQVLWDDKNTEKQAVRVLSEWAKSVMSFTSQDERPHQPVRIYTKHIGRCGEWEDLTNAAARACLIPTRGIEAFSSDHVWNEFWDLKWWQWEPVNTSFKDNLCYSNGWGKKFGTVFVHESNGVFTSTTNNYSQHTGTLSITALDLNGNPIDGAVISLYAMGTLDDVSNFLDSYGITDAEGNCTFAVDSGRTYTARMDSQLGNDPAATDQLNLLTENMPKDETLSFSFQAPNAKTGLNYQTLPMPTDTTKSFLIQADFTVNKQVVKWINYYDDISGTNTILEKDGGSVYSFVADEGNYTKRGQTQQFSAYNPSSAVAIGSYTFHVPEDKPWIAYLDNFTSLRNPVEVTGNFKLYTSPYVNVDDPNIELTNKLYQNYPNPVQTNTNISFDISIPGHIKLEIFNSNGEMVRQIVDRPLESGYYTFPWDIKDYSGNDVPQGIYVYRLNTGSQVLTGKMAVVK